MEGTEDPSVPVAGIVVPSVAFEAGGCVVGLSNKVVSDGGVVSPSVDMSDGSDVISIDEVASEV